LSQLKEKVELLNLNIEYESFFTLYSDLTKILRESRNEQELRHVWTEWHDKSGRPIKDSYARFVELSNSAAKLNGTIFSL